MVDLRSCRWCCGIMRHWLEGSSPASHRGSTSRQWKSLCLARLWPFTRHNRLRRLSAPIKRVGFVQHHDCDPTWKNDHSSTNTAWRVPSRRRRWAALSCTTPPSGPRWCVLCTSGPPLTSRASTIPTAPGSSEPSLSPSMVSAFQAPYERVLLRRWLPGATDAQTKSGCAEAYARQASTARRADRVGLAGRAPTPSASRPVGTRMSTIHRSPWRAPLPGSRRHTKARRLCSSTGCWEPQAAVAARDGGPLARAVVHCVGAAVLGLEATTRHPAASGAAHAPSAFDAP